MSSPVLAYVRARLAEPSTHAGLAAFLTALAAGVSAAGSRQAAYALLGAAMISGLRAAMTADPAVASHAEQVATVAQVLSPVIAAAIEDVLPQQAARVAALEAEVERLARLVPGP